MTLDEAIKIFEKELPDWWWSIGECSVSADASCGPDRNGRDAHLLKYEIFDYGFHHDEPMPASCADSLMKVMKMAKKEREKYIKK